MGVPDLLGWQISVSFHRKTNRSTWFTVFISSAVRRFFLKEWLNTVYIAVYNSACVIQTKEIRWPIEYG